MNYHNRTESRIWHRIGCATWKENCIMDFKAIGRRTRLIDGQSKVTGTIRYAPDLKLPGMLYARLVTSLHAHATVRNIDASEALAVPGVAAVLTANDLPNIPPSSRSRLLLARGRVIFAGQP